MPAFITIYAESAPPHDLLKVRYWKKHENVEHLPKILSGTKVWEAVEKHSHRWQSDMMAAALARQFFDGADYVHGDIDKGTLFFIPVYEKKMGERVILWGPHERENLWAQICKTYEGEKSKGVEDWEERANRKINDLLARFPADTWMPFTSLKSHHIITWILHMQAFDEKSGGELIRGFIENVEHPELCVMMFRLPETEFFRLKQLRKFISDRDRTLENIRLVLFKFRDKYRFPILCSRVGDELITVVLNHNPWVPGKSPVEKVLAEILESGVRCAIKVVRVRLSRMVSEKRKRPYWVIYDLPSEEEYHVGVSVSEGSVGRAEWASELLKRYAAWVCIEPQYGLAETCEKFVTDYALNVMEEIPSTGGASKPELKMYASPDVMFTIVEDYEKFLSDVERITGSSVVKGFSRSIFVFGLNMCERAFSYYEKLLNLKRRLHISINLSMVVTDPKFPFWRVMEIFKAHPDNFTIISRSGKMVSLNEHDFNLMKEIIPIVKRVKASVWNNEILPFSARSLEELEYELTRLSEGAKKKISSDLKNEILNFAREIERNHPDLNEGGKRSIRYAAFKRLSDFAGAKVKSKMPSVHVRSVSCMRILPDIESLSLVLADVEDKRP